jgi:hypothetical protein
MNVLFLFVTITVTLFSSSTFSAQEKNSTLVNLSELSVGRSFTWEYLNYDGEKNSWELHYTEKYIISKRDKKNIEILMTSKAADEEEFLTHHKMIVDLTRCEISMKNSNYRNWKIKFFRKVNSKWSLVSNAHKNLPFTEKFNCFLPKSSDLIQTTNFRGQEYFIRAVRKRENPLYASWYFMDHEILRGIAVDKIFLPLGKYRFRFLETR